MSTHRPLRRPQGAGLRQRTERLSLYLPIMVMGALALGSWWLVRNAPRAPSATGAQAVRHDPDYFMRDFSVRNFDAAGHLKNEVRGTVMRHYPDTETLEIDQVRMRAQGQDGRWTVATAKRALSNADGSEVQLFGNAVVTREPLPPQPGQPSQPRMEFRGDFLHAFTQTERVRSNQPVTLIRGADRFTADAMEYDNVEQVLQMRGRVHGVLMPKTGR